MRPWVKDVLAFLVAVLIIGGFGAAVAHHYLTTPECVTYEDDSWVCDDGTSGCEPGGLCE